MNFNQSCLMIFVCVLFVNCNSKFIRDQAETSTPNLSSDPKIIFLNYNILKSDDDLTIANLHSKIIVEGKIKKQTETETETKKGDIKCVQLDQQNSKIEEVHIKNPLSKNIEYVTSSGELATKQIEIDSAQLSIRMQLNHLTEYISLELCGESNTILLKTKI